MEYLLNIGSAKYTTASSPARKMLFFSSNLNMQNSVVMFTFSDFDCKYPFWVNLVQKIKIFSLFSNLALGLIPRCRIQWQYWIFLLFTVCCCHVTYAFQSESTFCGCGCGLRLWVRVQLQSLFCFWLELPFLGKFGPYNQNCLLNLKYGT